MSDDSKRLPGSAGEHVLQERFATEQRARAFYNRQMLDRLNDTMKSFIEKQGMLFIGTSDENGECDCGIRVGDPGFIHVLDDRTLVFPDYRGNGVFSSLGNILRNAHAGLFFVDFEETGIGLHVNGTARLVENDELTAGPMPERLKADLGRRGGRRPLRWVRVDVVEAYIQCAKHIPRMKRVDDNLAWGTDNTSAKGGDFFQARREDRPWYSNSDDKDDK